MTKLQQSSFARFREMEKERNHLREQLRQAASRFEDAAAILDADSSTENMAGFFRASAKRYYLAASITPTPHPRS